MLNSAAQQIDTSGPFQFYTEVQLVEVTGESVINLVELLDKLKAVGGSVIYCHTFRTMMMHHFLTNGFRNDFAHWVMDALGDDALGERLASIDQIEYTTIRSYREKMIEIIGGHLKNNPGAGERNAREEDRFFLCNAHSFIIPTGREAHNLEDLSNHLGRCSNNSLFFHFIEARLRVGAPVNDFSVWIAQNIGNMDLAENINKLDPYAYTLTQLRDKIRGLIEKEL